MVQWSERLTTNEDSPRQLPAPPLGSLPRRIDHLHCLFFSRERYSVNKFMEENVVMVEIPTMDLHSLVYILTQ